MENTDRYNLNGINSRELARLLQRYFAHQSQFNPEDKRHYLAGHVDESNTYKSGFISENNKLTLLYAASLN